MSRWIDKHLGFIFIAPAILFVLLMITFPILYNIGLSFAEWSMSNIKPPKFVGFGNYAKLFSDGRFWDAVGRTVYFVVVAILIQTFLGFWLAILLNRRFVGKNITRTLFLLPVVATPVAVGMVWMLMYEPTIGFINAALRWAGLPPQLFLASPSQVLPSLIFVDVWEWTPMIMLIVFAGLTAIPSEPYEQAEVDGATALQKLWHITLPLVSPSILTAMLLRLIDLIKTFDIIYATTKGGPGFSSETINILATVTAFQYFEFGRASAITVLFFIVVITISASFMAVKKRLEVDY